MDRGIKEIIEGNLSEVENGRVKMYKSLISSIDESGGYSVIFEISILNGMTVLELIDKLGQNNVRFYYDKS